MTKVLSLPISERSERAIARLKGSATSSIKQTLANAKRANEIAVVEACEAELRLRGFVDMTEKAAKQMLATNEQMKGKPLVEVIERAFTDVPPSHEEGIILRWVASNPGTTYAEFVRVYGKKDLSLAIGHLIYDRLNYFRLFLESDIKSDLLLTRTAAPSSVSYTLRPEAAEAFSNIGII